MRFGRIPVGDAAGAILAHSIRRGAVNFKKGRVLDSTDVETLRGSGFKDVVAAQLETGDLGEDEAASRVTEALLGSGITASAAFTGRCNLYVTAAGLLRYDPAALDLVNLVHEAVTVAALPPNTVVSPRQMIATIKIIPYGVAEPVIARVVAAARAAGPLLEVAPFRPTRCGLVQSGADSLKDSVLNKTRAVLAARLERLGSTLADERRCRHDEAEIGAAISTLAQQGCGMILVAGASATSDRRDVVPTGVERAGGAVVHCGMPVEPGNLLVLGRLEDGRPVICLPGCARSPALNGFDWVLERLLARVPVEPADIMRMGSGGLIKHQNVLRPERIGSGERYEEPSRQPRVAAVILAAGAPHGVPGGNPLFAVVDGEPAIRHTVAQVLRSRAEEVVVVAGHEAERLAAAISGTRARVVINEDYDVGLSSSLRAGVNALADDVDAAVICRGDMPDVQPGDIDRLIAAFDPEEGRLICVATQRGERGHPVLWARRFFEEFEQIRGEGGAKDMLERHAAFVTEVESGRSGADAALTARIA